MEGLGARAQIANGNSANRANNTAVPGRSCKAIIPMKRILINATQSRRAESGHGQWPDYFTISILKYHLGSKKSPTYIQG